MSIFASALAESGATKGTPSIKGTPLRREALSSFRGIQEGVTDRLGTLRGTREERLAVSTQPAKEELALQKGQATRGVGMEGSLASRRRSEIELGSELAEQDIEMRGMLDISQKEGGLQQMDTQFTSIINEMASQGFANELASLREVMNVFMAEKGAAMDASQLASQAKDASMQMWGRVAQSAAMEFGRQRAAPNTPSSGYRAPAAAGDAFMPAFQQRF